MKPRFFAVFLITLGVTATKAFALNTAAVLLTYPVHPRVIGMGETGVADNSDPTTVFYNPANVVANPKVYLRGARETFEEDFLSDLWVGRFSGGVSWQTGGKNPLRFGADVTFGRFDYGTVTVTDDVPGATPMEFSMFEDVLSLALGVGFTSGPWDFRVGTSVKRWWAKFPPAQFTQDNIDENPDAMAFDAGVVAAWHQTVAGWNVVPALGVSAIDMGSDVEVVEGEADPLPTRFIFGPSVRIESPSQKLGSAMVPMIAVVCNADGMQPKEQGFRNDFEWGIGSELAIAQIFFLRAGSHTYKYDDEYVSFGGWSVGLGMPIGPVRARFDYADSAYFMKHTLGLSFDWVF
jgi:hypothetical protein